MKAITVKLDEETLRDLEALSKEKGGSNQSDLVRQALRRFIAQERLEARRQALADYVQDREAQRAMAGLADADAAEAAELLRRAEKEK